MAKLNITSTTSSTTTAVTHGGVFHADEVFSTALLLLMGKDVELARVFRVTPEEAAGRVVFDIGGGQFDHHQKGGNGCHASGIPYAAFGLLWREYGHQLVSDAVFDRIEKRLVEAVDAVDNGVHGEGTVPVYGISAAISALNPSWDEDPAVANERFAAAVDLAKSVLGREIENARSWERAKDIVFTAIDGSKDGVLVLPRFAPWQAHLFAHPRGQEFLYVVFPSNRGGYNVQCVPSTEGGMDQKRPFPSAWKGCTGEAAQVATGVQGVTFVHPAGFLAACDSLESAMALAKRALQ